MGLLSDYLKIFTPAALAAGMALSPDEAEAMYVGPKAENLCITLLINKHATITHSYKVIWFT